MDLLIIISIYFGGCVSNTARGLAVFKSELFIFYFLIFLVMGCTLDSCFCSLNFESRSGGEWTTRLLQKL